MCSLFELGEERWLQLHPTCANMCSSWTERNISIVQSLLWLVRGGKLFSTVWLTAFCRKDLSSPWEPPQKGNFAGGCCVKLKEGKERNVLNIKCKCKMWTYRMWRWHENYDEDQDSNFMKKNWQWWWGGRQADICCAPNSPSTPASGSLSTSEESGQASHNAHPTSSILMSCIPNIL